MGAIEAPFPSSAWFVELVARATADPAELEHLGIADLRFGVEVLLPDGAEEFFGLVLDGFDINVVGPTTWWTGSRSTGRPTAPTRSTA